jgi:hypothetical protein
MSAQPSESEGESTQFWKPAMETPLWPMSWERANGTLVHAVIVPRHDAGVEPGD